MDDLLVQNCARRSVFHPHIAKTYSKKTSFCCTFENSTTHGSPSTEATPGKIDWQTTHPQSSRCTSLSIYHTICPTSVVGAKRGSPPPGDCRTTKRDQNVSMNTWKEPSSQQHPNQCPTNLLITPITHLLMTRSTHAPILHSTQIMTNMLLITPCGTIVL